ncbi:MAG TPA: metalloregulator ArsR/SmtB family transcription factor [Candidatus Saccharimonadales bacterium]
MDTFSALSVPTRRSIVEILATSGKLSAAQIGQNFNISAPAVSQHLKVLLECDLLTVERSAQRRIYEINPRKITEVQQWAANTIELWEHRLDTLDKVLEDGMNNKTKSMKE